mgnify:CR=1 FL=1
MISAYLLSPLDAEYDYVTARAVSRLNVLMELSSPMVKIGGKFIALKGPLAKEEAAECDGACKELKLDLTEKQKIILPKSFGKRYNLRTWRSYGLYWSNSQR